MYVQMKNNKHEMQLLWATVVNFGYEQQQMGYFIQINGNDEGDYIFARPDRLFITLDQAISFLEHEELLDENPLELTAPTEVERDGRTYRIGDIVFWRVDDKTSRRVWMSTVSSIELVNGEWTPIFRTYSNGSNEPNYTTLKGKQLYASFHEAAGEWVALRVPTSGWYKNPMGSEEGNIVGMQWIFGVGFRVWLENNGEVKHFIVM